MKKAALLIMLTGLCAALGSCTERRTAAPAQPDGDTIEVSISSQKAEKAKGAARRVIVAGPTAQPMDEEGLEPLDPFTNP